MPVPSITTTTTTTTAATHDSQQGRENNGATRKLSSSSSPSPMTTLTSCNSNDGGQHVRQNLHSVFIYDERLVKAILDKDDQLNNEVDELFDLESLFK